MFGSVLSCPKFGVTANALLLVCVAYLFSAVLGVSQAEAQVKYDPEHPVVQDMIKKALAFIEANPSNQIGNRVMMGMATYKANVLLSPNPKNHPIIQETIEIIKTKCTRSQLANSQDFSKMYPSALACIFLLELDADEYEDQILVLLEHIYERQQASGAWGYRQYPTAGDTSQMQYIALALWMAQLKGYKVDTAAAKRALQWMIDTQKSGGGWIYQEPSGVMPTAFGPDREIRHSIVAAGLGTVYLYADLLKLVDKKGSFSSGIRNDEFDLPAVVRDVTDREGVKSSTEKRKGLVSFDTGALRSTMNAGNGWFKSNFRPDPEKYALYYLYGFERYISLREYVDGDSKGVKNWYDEGVDYLKRIQTSAGSFPSASTDTTNVAKTCFGILFLTRSMQITINDKARGIAHGGDGLHRQSDTVLREKRNEIVSSSLDRNVDAFLELMDDPDNTEELENFERSLADLKLTGDDVSRARKMATIRMLVRHRNPSARLIAVEFLSRQRLLDNVPALLYALTDPDPRVSHAANTAMKFVSRVTDNTLHGLSEDPSESERKALQKRWTQWYLRIRPGAELLEEISDEKQP